MYIYIGKYTTHGASRDTSDGSSSCRIRQVMLQDLAAHWKVICRTRMFNVLLEKLRVKVVTKSHKHFGHFAVDCEFQNHSSVLKF